MMDELSNVCQACNRMNPECGVARFYDCMFDVSSYLCIDMQDCMTFREIQREELDRGTY